MYSNVRTIVTCGALLYLAAPLAFAQSAPAIPGIPGAMSWQNRPLDWHMDENKALTISAGAKTDWFVDPFDGTGAIAKFSEIAYDPQRVGNIYK